MISEDQIQDILNRVSISDVIKEYVDLKPKGKDFIGICPFHSDTNPSMSVSNEKKIFKCFSCGKGGNAITFVRDYLNVPFSEALKIVADIGGIKLDIKVSKEEEKRIRLLDINKAATDYFEVMLHHTVDGKKGLEYLEKRGLSIDTIKKFRIGLALNDRNNIKKFLNDQKYLDLDLLELGLIGKNGSNYYDTFQNRIMFPLMDNYGNIIGFSGRIFNGESMAKYVNTKETSLFHKSDVLYNFYQAKNDITKKDEVFVLEGFMDVIALDNIGITNAVASMGTALTDRHVNEILKLTKNVTLLFDGDDAGINASVKAIPKFSNANVKIVVLPEGLDPDEYVKKYGKNRFLEYIDKNRMDILNFNYLITTKGVSKVNIMDIEQAKIRVFNLLKQNHLSNTVIDQMLNRFSNEFNISYEMLYNDFYNLKIVKKEVQVQKERKLERNIKVIELNRYEISEFGLIKSVLYDKRKFLELDNFMEGRYIHFEMYQIREYLRKYFQINTNFYQDEFMMMLPDNLKEFFKAHILDKEYGDSEKYLIQLRKTFSLKFLIDKRSKLEELKKSDLISLEEKQRINKEIISLSKEIKSQEKR